jgi:hypothetical protein
MILAGKHWPSGDFSLASGGLRGAKPLGSSLLANSRNRLRGRQGAKGLTGFGKKMVRSGVALVERRAPRGTVSFATLTLPFNDFPQLVKAGGVWGGLMNRLLERLRRELVRKKLPAEIVFRTEPQKRGALHVHLIFQGRKSNKTWAVDTILLDKFWKDSLTEKGFVFDSIKSACNIQAVKKTAGGYMSKYLSKDDPLLIEALPSHPSRWWGMTDNLRDSVKNNIVKFSHSLPSGEMKWMKWMTSLCELPSTIFCHAYHDHDRNQFICLWGRMRPGGEIELEDFINSLPSSPLTDLWAAGEDTSKTLLEGAGV